jgi:hypothetical protein
MRLKLDESLPTILVEDLVELGHDVDTAMSEGLAGHEDPVPTEDWAGRPRPKHPEGARAK